MITKYYITNGKNLKRIVLKREKRVDTIIKRVK